MDQDSNLPEESNLYCFMDQNRPCRSDCMAWNVFRPEGPDYEEQWAHCKVLVDAHRVGKHVVALTAIVDGFVKKWKAQAADQQRPQPAPPPVVGVIPPSTITGGAPPVKI